MLEAVVSAYNNQGSFAIESVDMPDDMEWVAGKETAYAGNSSATPSNDGNWVATKNGNYFFIDSYGNILEEEPEQQTSEFNNYTFNTSINISNLNLSQEAPCFIILENNNNELIPIVIGLDNNDLVIECMISEDLEYKGSYPDAEWKSLTYDASLEEMVDNVISEPPTISNVKILSYREILENQNALNILTNDLLLHYFSSIN